MNTLVRCIDCNVIYALTPFDRSPEYSFASDTGLCHEIEKNDAADLECVHRGHRSEQLRIVENSLYSEGAYFDPLRVTYIEATNGKRTFLVKRWRKTITEAMRYELVEGRLEVNKTVEIQEQDIIRQLRHEIINPPFTEHQLYSFLEIVRTAAQAFDSELMADELYDSHDAHICYLPLHEEHIIRILQACMAVFKPRDVLRLEQFIRRNCEYNSVMSCIVRKHATFYPEPIIIPLANNQ
jgi:hypothetical protein